MTNNDSAQKKTTTARAVILCAALSLAVTIVKKEVGANE